MSFENTLRQNTPSQADIDKGINDRHYEELSRFAKADVTYFKELCEKQAQNGKTSCRHYAYYWFNCTLDGNDFYGEDHFFVGSERGGNLNLNGKISQKDKELFLELLYSELKKEGFENAKIEIDPLKMTRTTYSHHRRIFTVKVKQHSYVETVAEQIMISTSW